MLQKILDSDMSRTCLPAGETVSYTELRSRLEKSSVYEKLPSHNRDALITHWIHEPSPCAPLVSEEVHLSLIEAISGRGSVQKIAEPTEAEGSQLHLLWDDVPFPPPPSPRFRFIDLFAGIGGFRLALQRLEGKCVFSSEWDSDSKKTYAANFGEVPFGNIKEISEMDIPEHDVLCAGFPCQPFSQAGVSARNFRNTAHGFACETQGTLFFDVARIVQEKRPKVVFLENVKNLVRHDSGKTFQVVRDTMISLGYSFSFKLIDASPLVPQRRVRCYMVCVRDHAASFEFPQISGDPLPLKSILDTNVSDRFTISDRLWAGHQRRTTANLARGTGFTAFCADLDRPANTLVARYGKDGKECLVPQAESNPRMLTPRECARLQGFPELFTIPVAKTAAYKQFGNSVAVPVISKIAEKFVSDFL